MTQPLLKRILSGQSGQQPFAVLRRAHQNNILEIFSGKISQFETLDAIPLTRSDATLILLPYKQLHERHFSCVDDKTPLLVMDVDEYETLQISDFINQVPQACVEISAGDFDIDDARYADMVQSIIKDEIGYGEGSNFVIKRKFMADITEYTVQKALIIFQRLLQNETGAHWSFLIYTGTDTLVGASPELHVKLEEGLVTMNPISGTYRYPPSGPTLEGVMNFLSTSKEADELYMVVEEELKMMGRFCPQGGRISGPFLKEMSRLAHTEYVIQGQTAADPLKILHETMFSPAVIGSPLENACRVVAKYEPTGRGYYGGVAALISRDAEGNDTLDSTILIRTACIDGQGQVQISVGATIVHHSDPYSEAEETRAKAKALFGAMQETRELIHV